MSTVPLLTDVIEVQRFDAIVVGLHLRWNGVYQRPQHLLTRFAREVAVFVVEEPLADGRDFIETIVDGNVTIFRPHCSSPVVDVLAPATISAIRHALQNFQPLVWLYTPMMIALADAFSESPVVFDAMDELTKFAGSDARLIERESRLMRRASMVFCGGPSLYRSREGRARNVRLYASGVDVAFFESARTIEPHPAIAAAARPVFGYIGVIDERVDLELVAAIADARPDATICMIGPVAKIDSSTLPHRPNILYLGQQSYSDLPALLAGIDVALMPFALNASTLNISPTKTLEYLAAGKAVVSTAIPDVVSEYSNIITIAGDRTAFITALSNTTIDSDRRRAADDRTRTATWDAIAASMFHDLAQLGFVPLPTGARPQVAMT